MEIRIAVPRVPSGLLANLLGLLGLVAFAAAVGGLTGNWWWSGLVGSVFAVGLSYVAQTQATAAPQETVLKLAPDADRQMAEEIAKVIRQRPEAV